MSTRTSKKPQNATEAAVRLLARRGLSIAELRQKLAARGHEPNEVTGAVAQMEHYGYLDDTKLAEAVAADAARRGKGPLWVRAALRRRGLTAAEPPPERDPAELVAAARALIERRFGELTDQASRHKAYRFLCARGFAPNSVRDALAKRRGD